MESWDIGIPQLLSKNALFNHQIGTVRSDGMNAAKYIPDFLLIASLYSKPVLLLFFQDLKYTKSSQDQNFHQFLQTQLAYLPIMCVRTSKMLNGFLYFISDQQNAYL